MIYPIKGLHIPPAAHPSLGADYYPITMRAGMLGLQDQRSSPLLRKGEGPGVRSALKSKKGSQRHTVNPRV